MENDCFCRRDPDGFSISVSTVCTKTHTSLKADGKRIPPCARGDAGLGRLRFVCFLGHVGMKGARTGRSLWGSGDGCGKQDRNKARLGGWKENSLGDVGHYNGERQERKKEKSQWKRGALISPGVLFTCPESFLQCQMLRRCVH